MAQYIAFLRAINVSGHRIIKMDLLKDIFINAGYNNVATYIQSGNVYFETRKAKNDTLVKKLEALLLKELGFEVEVMVRTIEELIAIDKKEPYQHIEVDKTVAVYTGMLSGLPKQEQVEALYTFNSEIEECTVIGQEVYYLCYKNKGKPKLNNKIIEKKLNLYSTMRNRNTIRTLIKKFS